MRSEKLFDLLDDSGATTLTLIPRDQEGKSLGVIVVVAEKQMQEFLACLEEHWNVRTATVEDEDYGWNDG